MFLCLECLLFTGFMEQMSIWKHLSIILQKYLKRKLRVSIISPIFMNQQTILRACRLKMWQHFKRTLLLCNVQFCVNSNLIDLDKSTFFYISRSYTTVSWKQCGKHYKCLLSNMFCSPEGESTVFCFLKWLLLRTKNEGKDKTSPKYFHVRQ